MSEQNVLARQKMLREELALKHQTTPRLTVFSRQAQRHAWFPDLAKPEHMDGIIELRPDLVVFDGLLLMATLRSLTDGAAMHPVILSILRLKQAKVATLLVHHTGKSAASSFQGPPNLVHPFETVYKLVNNVTSRDAEAGEVVRAQFTLKCEKARDGRREPEMEARLVPTFPPENLLWVKETVHASLLKLYQLSQTGEYSTQEQLAAAVGVSRSRIAQMFREGAERGLWQPGEPQGLLKRAKQTSVDEAVPGEESGDF
jgi:hypothetical protein